MLRWLFFNDGDPEVSEVLYRHVLFGGAEIRVGEIGNPSGNGVGGQPVSHMLQLSKDSGTIAASA